MAAPGDECVDRNAYSSLPPDVARAVIANDSKADYWRAYLSEAESNYGGAISGQARELLPHRWDGLPVRVFVASLGGVSDEVAARAFGIPAADRDRLAQARAGRAIGEERQARICSLAADCQVVRVPTANHLVHNDALHEVTAAIRELAKRL